MHETAEPVPVLNVQGPVEAVEGIEPAAPASGLSVVSMSVGEPGARWMTTKLTMVMPHRTRSIQKNFLAKRLRKGVKLRFVIVSSAIGCRYA